MPQKPEILSVKEIARTRIFCIEELELKFSNGAERTYERLKAGGNGAVMIVAISKEFEFLLIREYAAGIDAYEWALPKGLIEKDESIFDAANRELMEETGFGAKSFSLLKSVSLAPGYLSHKMHIVLAQELFSCKLEGDEPEQIEVAPHSIHSLSELFALDDFSEARSIAALYLARDFLQQKGEI